ncbi:hypothetical protein GCM10018955_07710 [Planomonospora venezuelensis]
MLDPFHIQSSGQRDEEIECLPGLGALPVRGREPHRPLIVEAVDQPERQYALID